MSTDQTKQQKEQVDRILWEERERKNHADFVALLALLFKGFIRTEDPKEQQYIEEALSLVDLSEASITAHPAFRSAHPEYQRERAKSAPEAFNGAAQATQRTPGLLSQPQYVDAAIRSALSLSIEKYTEESIKRGVKYQMGQKDGNAIDCSGFVAQAVAAMQRASGMTDTNYRAIFAHHSNNQVMNLARETGSLLQGDQVNLQTMKAGMVIGIDSGDRRWDRGRTHGIDHIGIVYMDKDSGKLMFAESRGGVGVMTTPLEDYLKNAERRNWKLFAADAVKLASDEFKARFEQAGPGAILTAQGPAARVDVVPPRA